MNEKLIEDFMKHFKNSKLYKDEDINGKQCYELEIDRRSSTYFLVTNVENENDLKLKIFHWLSRPIYKEGTFRSRSKILNGVNSYLNSNFTWEDFRIIYINLGNAGLPEITQEFIDKNYDINFLRTFRED